MGISFRDKLSSASEKLHEAAEGVRGKAAPLKEKFRTLRRHEGEAEPAAENAAGDAAEPKKAAGRFHMPHLLHRKQDAGQADDAAGEAQEAPAGSRKGLGLLKEKIHMPHFPGKKQAPADQDASETEGAASSASQDAEASGQPSSGAEQKAEEFSGRMKWVANPLKSGWDALSGRMPSKEKIEGKMGAAGSFLKKQAGILAGNLPHKEDFSEAFGKAGEKAREGLGALSGKIRSAHAKQDEAEQGPSLRERISELKDVLHLKKSGGNTEEQEKTASGNADQEAPEAQKPSAPENDVRPDAEQETESGAAHGAAGRLKSGWDALSGKMPSREKLEEKMGAAGSFLKKQADRLSHGSGVSEALSKAGGKAKEGFSALTGRIRSAHAKEEGEEGGPSLRERLSGLKDALHKKKNAEQAGGQESASAAAASGQKSGEAQKPSAPEGGQPTAEEQEAELGRFKYVANPLKYGWQAVTNRIPHGESVDAAARKAGSVLKKGAEAVAGAAVKISSNEKVTAVCRKAAEKAMDGLQSVESRIPFLKKFQAKAQQPEQPSGPTAEDIWLYGKPEGKPSADAAPSAPSSSGSPAKDDVIEADELVVNGTAAASEEKTAAAAETAAPAQAETVQSEQAEPETSGACEAQTAEEPAVETAAPAQAEAEPEEQHSEEEPRSEEEPAAETAEPAQAEAEHEELSEPAGVSSDAPEAQASEEPAAETAEPVQAEAEPEVQASAESEPAAEESIAEEKPAESVQAGTEPEERAVSGASAEAEPQAAPEGESAAEEPAEPEKSEAGQEEQPEQAAEAEAGAETSDSADARGGQEAGEEAPKGFFGSLKSRIGRRAGRLKPVRDVVGYTAGKAGSIVKEELGAMADRLPGRDRAAGAVKDAAGSAKEKLAAAARRADPRKAFESAAAGLKKKAEEVKGIDFGDKAKESAGFLKSRLGSLKDRFHPAEKIRETAETAEEKLKQAADKAGSSIREAAGSARAESVREGAKGVFGRLGSLKERFAGRPADPYQTGNRGVQAVGRIARGIGHGAADIADISHALGSMAANGLTNRAALPALEGFLNETFKHYGKVKSIEFRDGALALEVKIAGIREILPVTIGTVELSSDGRRLAFRDFSCKVTAVARGLEEIAGEKGAIDVEDSKTAAALRSARWLGLVNTQKGRN